MDKYTLQSTISTGNKGHYSKDAGNYENPGSYYVLNDRLQAISTFYEIISSNEIWNITKQTEVKKLLYN